jgi:hypothetical protein
MIDLLSTGKNKKNISVRYLLLTFFVCISMVAWLGISDLRADVDDPEDNTDEIDGGFQNTAQEQHADNIAKAALSQDSNLNEDDLKEQIERWRESGMGWGVIVHKLNKDPYNLDIHPRVLGLGHSPISSEDAHSSKHLIMQSGNNQGQGLALGHSKNNSSNRGGGHGGGNGGDHGGGNGGGKNK